MRGATAFQLVRSIRNKYGLTMFRAKAGEEQSEVMDYIYDQIASIPDEAVPWIIANFATAYQRYPAVLDEAINERFQDWLRVHPEKRAKGRSINCSDCDSTGLLHVRSRENIHEVYCFQCVCGNFGSKAIPVRSRSSLLNDGYVLDNQELFNEYRVESNSTQYRTGFEPDYEQVMRELESRKQNSDVPF